ncbi:MAG TPA: hypothetical protein VK796_07355, partial [Cytophaga sp.]|nr:hypothetical protein [Cytophaga sp.]
KKNKESNDDYKKAKAEAIKNNVLKMHGHKTHEENLHLNRHNCYLTLTANNAFAFNSAISSNMQGELIIPYTRDNAPATFDKTFSLNHSEHNTSISLGLLSFEFGSFKRMYGKMELGLVLNNGNGPPSSMRWALGYNIKFTKKDVMILRPEIGFTYFNRTINIDKIDFNGATQIAVMGEQFKYYTDKDEHTDKVKISFRENVFSISPSIGLWLWPYSSKFVMRVGLGYNYVLSQKYNIDFRSNRGSLKESINNLNMQFSNTNGSSTNFFSYNGLFVNVGIGIRF